MYFESSINSIYISDSHFDEIDFITVDYCEINKNKYDNISLKNLIELKISFRKEHKIVFKTLNNIMDDSNKLLCHDEEILYILKYKYMLDCNINIIRKVIKMIRNKKYK